MISVFCQSHLNSLPQISQIKSDFLKLKKQGLQVDTLGKDSPFTRNTQCRLEKVWHIHLIPALEVGEYRRYDPERTSDAALIYCEDDVEKGVYCFIDILDPNAHEYYEDTDFMNSLADEAYKWRNWMAKRRLEVHQKSFQALIDQGLQAKMDLNEVAEELKKLTVAVEKLTK